MDLPGQLKLMQTLLDATEKGAREARALAEARARDVATVRHNMAALSAENERLLGDLVEARKYQDLYKFLRKHAEEKLAAERTVLEQCKKAAQDGEEALRRDREAFSAERVARTIRTTAERQKRLSTSGEEAASGKNASIVPADGRRRHPASRAYHSSPPDHRLDDVSRTGLASEFTCVGCDPVSFAVMNSHRGLGVLLSHITDYEDRNGAACYMTLCNLEKNCGKIYPKIRVAGK
ncbi:hypothetical protein C8R44DRAFT_731489 [Mycena epipterygia]|nr:hypothetical protein C8R44DRAFT_731489 [Mycena epipterygia]